MTEEPDIPDALVVEARQILAQESQSRWGGKCAEYRLYLSGQLDSHPPMQVVTRLLQERRDLQALVRCYQEQYPRIGPETAGRHLGGKNCSQGL
jgi:hypothetical protein